MLQFATMKRSVTCPDRGDDSVSRSRKEMQLSDIPPELEFARTVNSRYQPEYRRHAARAGETAGCGGDCRHVNRRHSQEDSRITQAALAGMTSQP